MPADAIAPAIGNECSPSRRVCGTGPIRSIGLFPTKARTELVPKINISAMIGDAIRTERPMSRAGERVSPARMATYSNPLSAPTPSFAENVEAEKDRHRRQGERQWLIVFYFTTSETEQRQANQRRVDQEHGEGADIVKPLA